MIKVKLDGLKHGFTFKELLELLDDHSRLAARFLAAMGREPQDENDPGPIVINSDLFGTVKVSKASLKSRDALAGRLQDWRRDPNYPGDYYFTVSVRMTDSDMRQWGIDLKERTNVSLIPGTKLSIWFRASTASSQDGYYEATAIEYVQVTE
jgi:hypothetical protein